MMIVIILFYIYLLIKYQPYNLCSENTIELFAMFVSIINIITFYTAD
jgi:hypothetical protein